MRQSTFNGIMTFIMSLAALVLFCLIIRAFVFAIADHQGAMQRVNQALESATLEDAQENTEHMIRESVVKEGRE